MKKFFTLLVCIATASTMCGQLIINEVLYDPSNNALDGDANGDGVYDQEEDSFIEFYNSSTTNFDFSGYQIWDDTTGGKLRYVIPAGTFIPPRGVAVVFGGGTLVGNFGGAVVIKTDSAVGMNLNNSGEVIVIKDPMSNTVLTFDSDALSNNPNESYTRNPDVTGMFEQHADNTPLLFSPGTKVDGTPFDTVFVVSSIDVQGQGGATTITTNGGTLQMVATVLPSFADDPSVTWSISSGNTFGSISPTGLLTALGNGVVTVKAVANDTSATADSVDITISNQTIGLGELAGNFKLSIYPNPAADMVFIKANTPISEVKIYSLTGKLVKSFQPDTNNIDISELQKGAYLLQVIGSGYSETIALTKQ